ncbi:hypothetical protein EIN_167720 [Entamoeba invadens IP1]|uniref:Uncharacterized protein n=1 Tax=Entamoeba invadens IP1 TaxID=370355 RepID=A0A0A1TVK4_ENTIV|nr:hypothetical protein EIN_167720 [Entamoeba invadens IP1]ELP84447.1 hypothetical protein EIN_167720 [Entamoeba invadens IP1]|eukprot:XP_004183793.1 hypothetical protein EIN_167720 [Entamoeba invadens IP1]
MPTRLEPFYLLNVFLYIEPKMIPLFEQVSGNCATAISMMHTNPPLSSDPKDVKIVFTALEQLNTLQISSDLLPKIPDEYLEKVQKIQLTDRDFFVGGHFARKFVFANHLPMTETKYPYLKNLKISDSSLYFLKENLYKYPELEIVTVYFTTLAEVAKTQNLLDFVLRNSKAKITLFVGKVIEKDLDLIKANVRNAVIIASPAIIENKNSFTICFKYGKTMNKQ